MKVPKKLARELLGRADTPVVIGPVSCDIPVPPSANHLWRTAHYQEKKTRVYLSRPYKEWLRVAVPLLSAGLPRFVGPVSIGLTIHRGPGWRRDRDLSNSFKAAEDALRHAGVIEDDSTEYVQHIVMRFGDRFAQKAYCTITVEQFRG